MKTFMILLTASLIASPVLATAQPPDEVAAGLAKIAESRIRALEQAAAKDPRTAQEIAAYRVAVKNVLQARMNEAAKTKQLNELSRRIEPAVQGLMQKAGIDEKQYKEEGEQHIRRMAAHKKKSYEAKYLGYLGWYWKLIPTRKTSPKPADKEVILSAPFPQTQIERNGSGTVSANEDEGTYSVNANVAMVGGHDNVGGLAHFFRVEDDLARIQTFAALPETQYTLSALADVFAVFGASARSRIDIFSNNRVVCSEEVEHGNILAPVLYVASKSGSDNVVTNCDIPAPRRGDEIVVRATSVAGAWGGLIGFAASTVTAAPRDLRLLLKF